MTTPHLLLLGGSPVTVRRAIESGARVTVWRTTDDGPTLADETTIVDYADARQREAAAVALHRRHPITAAVSLTEAGLLPAAFINHQLGLDTTALRVATLLKDKNAMRRRMAEAGCSPVMSRPVRGRPDATAFAKACGTPIIIKPARGVGSRHIHRIEQHTDLDQVAWDAYSDWIAEEYLPGHEMSVEAFTHRRRHHIIAVTAKRVLPSHVEIGHTVPAPIPATLRSALDALVTEFLDVVGVEQGPSHTEVKLTPRGPRIIESHNRVGGDRISDLVSLATGVDLRALTFASLVGQPVTVPQPRTDSAAAIQFLTAPPGKVHSISGTEDVLALPGVVDCVVTTNPGDNLAPVVKSADRVGHVLVRATDPMVATRTAIEAATRIHIEARLPSGRLGHRQVLVGI